MASDTFWSKFNAVIASTGYYCWTDLNEKFWVANFILKPMTTGVVIVRTTDRDRSFVHPWFINYDLQIGMYLILNPSPTWHRVLHGFQRIQIRVWYSLDMYLEPLLGKPTRKLMLFFDGKVVIKTYSFALIGIDIPAHVSASLCMRTDTVFAQALAFGTTLWHELRA